MAASLTNDATKRVANEHNRRVGTVAGVILGGVRGNGH